MLGCTKFARFIPSATPGRGALFTIVRIPFEFQKSRKLSGLERTRVTGRKVRRRIALLAKK